METKQLKYKSDFAEFMCLIEVEERNSESRVGYLCRIPAFNLVYTCWDKDGIEAEGRFILNAYLVDRIRTEIIEKPNVWDLK